MALLDLPLQLLNELLLEPVRLDLLLALLLTLPLSVFLGDSHSDLVTHLLLSNELLLLLIQSAQAGLHLAVFQVGAKFEELQAILVTVLDLFHLLFSLALQR